MKIILAEKPQAARKIESIIGVKTIPLVGHLLGLQKHDRSWTPPYFNIDWKPMKGKADKLEKIKDALTEKPRTKIFVATDYDAEGQLIALNILRYSNINPRRVSRMKFSSLEADEILRAYQNPIPFDRTFALQAEVRHYLDWYFGMNISKTITTLRQGPWFVLTPVGRVQSPTLNWLVDREKEISDFVVKDVWFTNVSGVYGVLKNKSFEISSFSFDDKEHAEDYMNKVLYGKVDRKEVRKFLVEQHPPNTDWMMEYGLGLGLSADIVAKILQDLYLNEYCSYPRTDSEQYLSHGVDTQRYLKQLVGEVDGSEEALGRKPLEGIKDDVHPAIYPIRVYPEKDSLGLMWKEIARAFVACHLPPEERVHEYLYVDIGGEVTLASECPKDLHKGDEFELTYNLKKGRVMPPARYKQRDVYSWMSNSGIGTRDTRPLIITKVLKRYTFETTEGIFLSSLGMKVVNILSEYCPDLISVNLTKKFEEQISQLKQGRRPKSILSDARVVVTDLVRKLFDHKEEVFAMF